MSKHKSSILHIDLRTYNRLWVGWGLNTIDAPWEVELEAQSNASASMKACRHRALIFCSPAVIGHNSAHDLSAAVQLPRMRGERGERREQVWKVEWEGQWAVTRFMPCILDESRHLPLFTTGAAACPLCACLVMSHREQSIPRRLTFVMLREAWNARSTVRRGNQTVS
jgi:hypothetical protein